jgi:hypothetical protein
MLCGPLSPCMAHPWVVGGGGSLWIWRVAVNILNKQPQVADKGWSLSFGGGEDLTIPHCKMSACYKMLTQDLGTGWILWND